MNNKVSAIESLNANGSKPVLRGNRFKCVEEYQLKKNENINNYFDIQLRAR